MKNLLLLFILMFSSQAISGFKITCTSETEMHYHQSNTLDNQLVKNEWIKNTAPSPLNIELVNDDYLLVNNNKTPIVNKMGGVLLVTMSSKEFPATEKDQGTIVTVSLAINFAIPAVTKTSSMTKYFLSSDVQASATSYKCKFDK